MLNDIAEDQKTREKERGRYIERKKETQRASRQTQGGGGGGKERISLKMRRDSPSY